MGGAWRYIEHDGEVLTVAGWARRLGMDRDTLGKRLAKWPVEEALDTEAHPVQRERASIIEYNGERLTREAWAGRLGISVTCLVERMRKWPLERALRKDPREARSWTAVSVEEAERRQRAREEQWQRDMPALLSRNGRNAPGGRLGSAYLPAVKSPHARECLHCGDAFEQCKREGRILTCSGACRKAYIADWPHEIDEAV